MPLSTLELNRLADDIVSSALRCNIHSGAPGVDGDDDRITPTTGNAYRDLAAASWSDAAAGDVQYEADVEFGVLHASNSVTVTHWSIFRGTAFVASGAVSPNVVVTAGGTFKLNEDTIDLNGSTS